MVRVFEFEVCKISGFDLELQYYSGVISGL